MGKNYSLVINSKFQPFSFERYIQPYQIYGQAYREQEDALADLATQAAIWDRRTEGSEKAHRTYKEYQNDLKNIADTLSKYGLSPQSRGNMINMRRRYASDITPIEEAWNKRQADMKVQQEALLKDPTHYFNRQASTISLDEYIDNPSLDILSENYSGALLEQEVANAVKSLQNIKDYRALKKLELPFQYYQDIIKGITAEDVRKVLTRDKDANPLLVRLVENTMESSGMQRWSSMNGNYENNAMYQDAWRRAARGLMQGIGGNDREKYHDTYSEREANADNDFTRQMRAKAQAQLQSNLDNIVSNFSPRFERKNIFTDTERNEMTNEWNKYKKYFYKDPKTGRYIMNQAGRNQSLTSEVVTSAPHGVPITHTRVSDFGKFIKKYGLEGLYNSSPGPNQDKVIDKLRNVANNNYDSRVATEYYKVIDQSNHDNVMSILNNAASDGELKTYSYKRGDKGNLELKETGDKLNVSSLKKEQIKSASVHWGKHGDYLKITLDGEEHKIPIKYLSDRYNNLVQGGKGDLEGYSRMIAEGKTHKDMGYGYLAKIEDLMTATNNAIGDNLISLFGTSTVENDKVKQNNYVPEFSTLTW